MKQCVSTVMQMTQMSRKGRRMMIDNYCCKCGYWEKVTDGLVYGYCIHKDSKTILPKGKELMFPLVPQHSKACKAFIQKEAADDE